MTSGANVGPQHARHRGKHRARERERVPRIMLTVGRMLASVLAPFGVDRPRFLALLHARLTIDFARGRRSDPAGHAKVLSSNFTLTLFLHVVLGCVLAGMLVLMADPRVALFWTFGVAMTIVTMTLMSEHASTLFESTDLAVLGPLPVTGRTVLASRVAHVLLYFVLIVGSLGLAPLVAGVFRFGALFVPAFAITLALGTVTCMAAAIGLLLLALRFVAAARLRAALLLTQAVISASAVFAWQMIPHLARLSSDWLTADAAVWPWLLPPAHCAALASWLVGAPGGTPLARAALAVVIPALLLVALAAAASRFQERLLAMTSAEHARAAPRLRRFWRDLLLHDPEAKLGYDFAGALVGREQVFRMRVWPMLVISWVFTLVMMFRLRRGEFTHQPALACSALYFVGMVMPQVLTFARFSEHWQARQVFRAHPVQRPGQLVAGALLALLLRFCVPALVFTFVVTLTVGGLGILPDAVFALLATSIVTLIALQTHSRRMPFTERFEMTEVHGSMVRMLTFLVIVGLLAAGHAMLRTQPAIFGLGLAFLAILTVVMFLMATHSLRNTRHAALLWPDEHA